MPALAFALLAEELKARHDGRPGVVIKLGEGQVLKLALDAVHADTGRQRRIDIHGLAGDAVAFLRVTDKIERAHVVQAVSELDQQHPNIVGHGEQQFAEIFRLFGLIRLQLKAGQLGDPVNQAGDFIAEQVA